MSNDDSLSNSGVYGPPSGSIYGSPSDDPTGSGWAAAIGISSPNGITSERPSVFNQPRSNQNIRRDITGEKDEDGLWGFVSEANSASPSWEQGTGEWEHPNIPDWHKQSLIDNEGLSFDADGPVRNRSQGYFDPKNFKLRSPISNVVKNIEDQYFHIEGSVTSGRFNAPHSWSAAGRDFDPYTNPSIFSAGDEFTYPPTGMPTASANFTNRGPVVVDPS